MKAIQPMKAMATLGLALVMMATGTAQADTFGSGANTFTIDFVTVGAAGNADDTTGKGAVAYDFRIGMFEVSQGMVTKANNAGSLGITQTSSGANQPATNVSWNEAARFVNWLNTSNGYNRAYKFALEPGDAGYNPNANLELWMGSDAGYNALNPFRNSDAFYFLPSEDEWYKAAFYNGSGMSYFDYTTSSDTVPDGIDFNGDTNFEAVFNDGFAQPTPNDIFNAGSAASPWGTFGQGGNVYERVETAKDRVNDTPGEQRLYWGGYWTQPVITLGTGGFGGNTVDDSDSNVGFRVASIPEPSSGLLIITGLAAMVLTRRSK